MAERQDEPGCGQHGAHAGLAGELRAFAITALDRLQPALERIRADAAGSGDTSGSAESAPAPASCTICPICALVAAVRGERPELATRLAEQAADLLAVLRSALDEGVGAPGPVSAEPGASSAPTGPARPVQRIPVHRT
ncbi:hypothetical protein [Pseudonocardia sp. H11422]|uniref:hypothetical protein n=1 Tax=Pseudonocardia sp. H11422 TaxID=2835866 RepID=UPI001BDC0ADA|nr:hypothetical protein [Pseudonocardia sp. H11422]